MKSHQCDQKEKTTHPIVNLGVRERKWMRKLRTKRNGALEVLPMRVADGVTLRDKCTGYSAKPSSNSGNTPPLLALKLKSGKIDIWAH